MWNLKNYIDKIFTKQSQTHRNQSLGYQKVERRVDKLGAWD